MGDMGDTDDMDDMDDTRALTCSWFAKRYGRYERYGRYDRYGRYGRVEVGARTSTLETDAELMHPLGGTRRARYGCRHDT
jgi:hypothetical protein